MNGDDNASSGKGGEAAAAPYTPDDHSPETSTGLCQGSPLEKKIRDASELITENQDLKQKLEEAQTGTDVLGRFYQEQLEARDARIQVLENTLARNGISVPQRKRPQRQRSDTIPGIPIVIVGEESPAPEEQENVPVPLEDPQRYLDEILLRIKVALTEPLREANGDYRKFFELLTKRYQGARRSVRDDIYGRMLDLGASESAAAEFKMRAIEEDVIRDTITDHMKVFLEQMEETVNVFDVRAQNLARRRQEIAREEQALQDKLAQASTTMQRASEVESGLKMVEQKTEEVRQVLAQRSKLDEDKRQLEDKKEELKGLASAVKTFYNRVTGAADENRAIMTRAYSGFGPRLDNIIKEYSTQGAAIVPAIPYREALGESVKDPDVIRGTVSPEQKERLTKILEKGSHPETPLPQRDDILGWYFVTAIRKQGTAVANFCVFGIEEKDGRIEQQRFAQLVATSNSVRDTVVQHYAGMHFLSESGPSGYLKEKIDIFFEQVRNL